MNTEETMPNEKTCIVAAKTKSQGMRHGLSQSRTPGGTLQTKSSAWAGGRVNTRL
jgi:hypothetical protein